MLQALVLGRALRHARAAGGLGSWCLHLQAGAGALEVFVQVGTTNRLRPGAVGEHPWVGAQGHGSVDQAAAAQAIADQGRGALAEAEIEQGVFIADGIGAAAGIQFGADKTAGLAEVAGKLAGQVFVAALQQGHALTMLGKAQGRHCAAIARANHHHVGAVGVIRGLAEAD